MHIHFENLEKIDDILSCLKSLEKSITGQKRWLNTKEAAYYLGYSEDRLYDLKDNEFIENKHFYKKGKLLFDRIELDNWVMQGKHLKKATEIVDNVLKDLI